jgi:hypothetical protein
VSADTAGIAVVLRQEHFVSADTAGIEVVLLQEYYSDNVERRKHGRETKCFEDRLENIYEY